jgi:hypothetical protein
MDFSKKTGLRGILGDAMDFSDEDFLKKMKIFEIVNFAEKNLALQKELNRLIEEVIGIENFLPPFRMMNTQNGNDLSLSKIGPDELIKSGGGFEEEIKIQKLENIEDKLDKILKGNFENMGRKEDIGILGNIGQIGGNAGMGNNQLTRKLEEAEERLMLGQEKTKVAVLSNLQRIESVTRVISQKVMSAGPKGQDYRFPSETKITESDIGLTSKILPNIEKIETKLNGLESMVRTMTKGEEQIGVSKETKLTLADRVEQNLNEVLDMATSKLIDAFELKLATYLAQTKVANPSENQTASGRKRSFDEVLHEGPEERINVDYRRNRRKQRTGSKPKIGSSRDKGSDSKNQSKLPDIDFSKKKIKEAGIQSAYLKQDSGNRFESKGTGDGSGQKNKRIPETQYLSYEKEEEDEQKKRVKSAMKPKLKLTEKIPKRKMQSKEKKMAVIKKRRLKKRRKKDGFSDKMDMIKMLKDSQLETTKRMQKLNLNREKKEMQMSQGRESRRTLEPPNSKGIPKPPSFEEVKAKRDSRPGSKSRKESNEEMIVSKNLSRRPSVILPEDLPGNLNFNITKFERSLNNAERKNSNSLQNLKKSNFLLYFFY